MANYAITLVQTFLTHCFSIQLLCRHITTALSEGSLAVISFLFNLSCDYFDHPFSSESPRAAPCGQCRTHLGSITASQPYHVLEHTAFPVCLPRNSCPRHSRLSWWDLMPSHTMCFSLSFQQPYKVPFTHLPSPLNKWDVSNLIPSGHKSAPLEEAVLSLTKQGMGQQAGKNKKDVVCRNSFQIFMEAPDMGSCFNWVNPETCPETVVCQILHTDKGNSQILALLVLFFIIELKVKGNWKQLVLCGFWNNSNVIHELLGALRSLKLG